MQVGPELELVTVKVSWVEVTELMATDVPLATPLMFLLSLPAPLVRSILTVGAAPLKSKTKPAGAFKMIVPAPTFPEAFSE